MLQSHMYHTSLCVALHVHVYFEDDEASDIHRIKPTLSVVDRGLQD
jgi:hypothetical protein